MQERAEEHFVGLVAQKAVIERNGKVLFVRSSEKEGKWDLPGGRLHIYEEPLTSLRRELLEELGVRDCDVDEFVYAGQFFHSGAEKPCLFLTFAVSIPEDAVITLAEDELDAYDWLAIEDCDENMVYRNCMRALEVYVKNAEQ